MKAALAAPLALVALAAASVASAQTAPQTAPAGGSDITRMLNGGPPAATAPAPAPAPVRTSPPTSTPAAATPTTPQRPAPSTSAAPAVTSPRPSAAPPTSAPGATTTPVAEEEAEAAPPPPPPWTLLDPAATAALPFRAELPTGFAITEGRPGPDFHVYTIRRGEQPFVMVYVGDYSQFPIYDGELVQAGGRASIVLTEEGRRIAVEHLFDRQASPTQVHVWLASLDPADRAVAERIGQSVDIR
jgi:hypothetical protein